jgi:hypothetical protein
MDFLKNLSTSQIWAQARQYLTYAAGIATAFGLITLTQKAVVIDNVEQIMTGLQAITASVATIAGAVVLIINTFKANKAASPESAVQRVKDIATTPTGAQAASGLASEAKVALVQATNALPEVKGVVTMPTTAGVDLASSVPEPTIVPAGTADAEIIARGTAR